jgi:hypothetical protein
MPSSAIAPLVGCLTTHLQQLLTTRPNSAPQPPAHPFPNSPHKLPWQSTDVDWKIATLGEPDTALS